MIKIVKKIALEPLFHFLVVGFVLYLFYDVSSDEQVKSKKIIEISPQELQQIKSEYKKEFSKDISEDELDASIQKKYYEKMLLNEAYSLGLEKQDELISKRLLEQMQHIMTGSAVMEPSEELLYKYYEKNKGDYSSINTLTFSQIYFYNPKNEAIFTTLKALQIADVNPLKASSFGEESASSNQIKDVTFGEVEELYGKYFASKVFSLKRGMWHKAIQSKYGVHLVYVTDKNVGEPYSFDEIQERVYADYMQEERQKKEDEAYRKISSQYSLEVK